VDKVTASDFIELIEKIDVNDPIRAKLAGFYKYLQIVKQSPMESIIVDPNDYEYVQRKISECSKQTRPNLKCWICRQLTDITYANTCEKCFIDWVISVLNARRNPRRQWK